MFNEGHYLYRVQAGELRTQLHAEAHPSPPRAQLPPCTRSQIIAYLDDNLIEVALVHQYLLPNGSVAGLPDPKRLFKDGILYFA